MRRFCTSSKSFFLMNIYIEIIKVLSATWLESLQIHICSSVILYLRLFEWSDIFNIFIMFYTYFEGSSWEIDSCCFQSHLCWHMVCLPTNHNLTNIIFSFILTNNWNIMQCIFSKNESMLIHHDFDWRARKVPANSSWLLLDAFGTNRVQVKNI